MDPSREIPREVVTALLEAACWAPTHGLTQPWRFQVFATAPARARLGEGLVALYDELTPGPNRDEAKRSKLRAGVERAPVVITLAAKVVPGGKVPEWEEIAAVSCAVQNLLLAAHERGIGSFWSSPPAACAPQFVRWLGLDGTHRAMGLVYLGWPRPGSSVPQSLRLPLAERVTWHEA